MTTETTDNGRPIFTIRMYRMAKMSEEPVLESTITSPYLDAIFPDNGESRFLLSIVDEPNTLEVFICPSAFHSMACIAHFEAMKYDLVNRPVEEVAAEIIADIRAKAEQAKAAKQDEGDHAE